MEPKVSGTPFHCRIGLELAPEEPERLPKLIPHSQKMLFFWIDFRSGLLAISVFSTNLGYVLRRDIFLNLFSWCGGFLAAAP
jgi:hypothetical protein